MDSTHVKAVGSESNFNKKYIIPFKSESALEKAMIEGKMLHEDDYNIIIEIWNPKVTATTIPSNTKATRSYIFVRNVQACQAVHLQQIFSSVGQIRNVRFTSYRTAILELDTIEEANTILATKLCHPNNNLECEFFFTCTNARNCLLSTSTLESIIH